MSIMGDPASASAKMVLVHKSLCWKIADFVFKVWAEKREQTMLPSAILGWRKWCTGKAALIQIGVYRVFKKNSLPGPVAAIRL